MTSRRQVWLGLVLTVPLLYWVAPSRAGTITYDVAADTTSVLGTTGSLDFQFNSNGVPGMDSATINAFSGGSSGAVLFTAGNVTSDLTALPPLILSDNSSSITNEITQAFSFSATMIQFIVTLVTAAGSPGPSFYFTMLDQDGTWSMEVPPRVSLWKSTMVRAFRPSPVRA